MKLSFIQLFKSLFLSALVLLSIMAPQLYADYVTPSERVESHLYIRELPESGSNIIGRLLPGESIELVESIAYYYKVIHQGRDGYVSKSWSYVISTPTNTTQDKSNDLIIGSWNIKWFGNSSTDSHNYQRNL